MDDVNLLKLFAVPVYQTKINNLTDEVKNSLKQIQFELMHDESGYYSVEKYILNNSEYKLLFEEIDFHVKKYIYEILKIKKTYDFYLTTSWVVKQVTNNYANPHSHVNSLFSGVLYFSEDDKFGRIVFQNKSDNLFYKTFDIQFEQYNEINSEYYWVYPKKDMLILFPSNLTHLVGRNESEETRYSLAFNYFIRGTLGVSTSVIKI